MTALKVTFTQGAARKRSGPYRQPCPSGGESPFQARRRIDAFLAEQQSPLCNYHKCSLRTVRRPLRLTIMTWPGHRLAAIGGLKIDNVARSRHWITFSGTASGGAPSTPASSLLVNGETHFANVDAPSVPAASRSGGRIHRFGRFQAGLANRSARVHVEQGQALAGADDLAAIYNIAPLYAPVSMATARTSPSSAIPRSTSPTSAPSGRFQSAEQRPHTILWATTRATTGRGGIQPDIEWANAIARGAQIIYVYGQDVFGAAQFAVDFNVAPVMSSASSLRSLQPGVLPHRGAASGCPGITWLASSATPAAPSAIASPHPQAAKVCRSTSVQHSGNHRVGGTQLDDTSAQYWQPPTPLVGLRPGLHSRDRLNDTPFIGGSAPRRRGQHSLP